MNVMSQREAHIRIAIRALENGSCIGTQVEVDAANYLKQMLLEPPCPQIMTKDEAKSFSHCIAHVQGWYDGFQVACCLTNNELLPPRSMIGLKKLAERLERYSEEDPT